MEKKIIYFWQQLNKKYSSENVFFMLAYWTLVVYTQILRCKPIPETLEEWRNGLLSFFKDLMEYDVKESAVRLSDRVEWALLMKDGVMQEILWEYAETIFDFLPGKPYEEKNQLQYMQERLLILMEALYDLAAVNTPYLTTPKSIREVVSALFASQCIGSMAEISGGSGAIAFSVWKNLEGCKKVSYHGEGIELALCDISCLLAHMLELRDINVFFDETMGSHTFNKSTKYDLVLLDVPRGQTKNISDLQSNDWFDDSDQKNIFTDWMYVVKSLDILSENGRGVVIVTPGSLARKNEANLRKKLIQNDWIEAVISLPPNLYPNVRTGSEMIIFNKEKPRQREGKILFVDISRYYYRDNRNYYSIMDEGMKLLRQAFEEYRKIPQISNILPITRLDQEIWSLKPLRYIENQVEETEKSVLLLKDAAQITRGAQLRKEEEERLCDRGTSLFLNIKDIQDGEIHYEDAGKICPKNYTWYDKFQVREDDIIITSKGANFKIAIVEENPPEAFICGNLTLLRVNPKIYHPYVLLEYLNSEKGMRALESIQSGTTIRILNTGNLERLQIPAYHPELMNSVGERLKSKRKKFKQQMKQLTEQYTMERKVLLEMIELEEEGYGKDIYQS